MDSEHSSLIRESSLTLFFKKPLILKASKNINLEFDVMQLIISLLAASSLVKEHPKLLLRRL